VIPTLQIVSIMLAAWATWLAVEFWRFWQIRKRFA